MLLIVVPLHQLFVESYVVLSPKPSLTVSFAFQTAETELLNTQPRCPFRDWRISPLHRWVFATRESKLSYVS